MEKKNLYCKQCHEFPDQVVSEEVVFITRNWDGQYYQADDMNYGENIKYYCPNCDDILIIKE